MIRKTRDDRERTNAQKSLKDTERSIDELEEQLDKLEIGFKSAYLADAALMQEEEDEDDWVPVPVSPIKVRVLPLFL